MGRLSSRWLILFLVFSTVGLFASVIVIYTYYYLHTQPPFCTSFKSPFPGVTVDCEIVLSSKYSDIGGVPLDFLAAVWFVVNVALVITYDLAGAFIAGLAVRFLYFWRFVGIAIVPYLIYVEFAILHAVCIYCTIMHAMIIVDFTVITLYLLLHGLSIKDRTK